jgi:Cu/Ag efflux pump CusA
VDLLAVIMAAVVGCRSHHATVDASAPLASSVGDSHETVIDVDTTRLAAYGLTLADVQHTIALNHVHVETRAPSSFVVVVRGPTEPTIVLDFVIAVRGGVPIRISDVARIAGADRDAE